MSWIGRLQNLAPTEINQLTPSEIDKISRLFLREDWICLNSAPNCVQVSLLGTNSTGDDRLLRQRTGASLRHCNLRGQWAIDFRKDCSLWCVITRNWKQILTFSFFCCVDKHPKSITSCKNVWFNTRWLCYSVWGKTHVFHNSGFNSETILPVSIFSFW